MAGKIELLIYELGVEALHHDVDGVDVGVAVLVVHEIDAVALQLAVKGLRAGEIDLRAGVVLVQILARGHAGGEHVFRLAREAQLAQTGDVINARAGGVVRQVNVVASGLGDGVDEVHRAVKHVVAQIERAVHVEQKQAGVDESFVVHGGFLLY